RADRAGDAALLQLERVVVEGGRRARLGEHGRAHRRDRAVDEEALAREAVDGRDVAALDRGLDRRRRGRVGIVRGSSHHSLSYNAGRKVEISKTTAGIARALLRWYDRQKRDLAWRREPSPYRTLVSEFMLQQTVVATVEPYFARFMARFPDVATLAAAT